MKSFTTVAAIGIIALAVITTKTAIADHFADKDFLVKQKFVLEIFQHIYQDDVFVTKFDTSFYEYKPWEHVADYHHPENLTYFFELWQHEPMHDDEIFTVMYNRHEEYAHGLSRVFFFAKDWETFTHAVFWARTHVNKQLFVYALHIAVLHRPDMVGVVMPAIYEILPWHFFDVDTLEMAEKHKMHGFHTVKKLDNIYNVVIRSNYSNVYGDVNHDHSTAYFLEDVGLNAFYYYYNLDYPFWTKGPQDHLLNHDRRGELYFYVHWQLLARYYLERLSNDLGEVPHFNIYDSVDSGYFSGLHYYKGVNFPDRDNHYNFYYGDNVEYTKFIELYSIRIMDFIHKHQMNEHDAVNVLGNIVQGNVDSMDKKWFGSVDKYYHYMVNEGRPYGKYHEHLPTTFMHYETAVRDPLFFEMYKEIVFYYWEMMKTFPEYTTKDFVFDGVKINEVHMPEGLTTYFEYFDSDISNAVNVEVPHDYADDHLVTFGRNSHHDGHSFVVKARELRLNHKPFEFEMHVHSDKAQKAVVKVFIGPKYDEHGRVIHMEDNYMNFFELEHFVVDLVAGDNVVKRNSVDFHIWVNDRTKYLELYQKVMDATNADYKFPLNQHEAHCGIPHRIMLPKGKKGGMPYQFFFMVYKYVEPTVKHHTGYDPEVSCGVGSGARYVDNLPFGFPFNRPVHHEYYFHVPNFHFHDVKIYHKDDNTNVV